MRVMGQRANQEVDQSLQSSQIDVSGVLSSLSQLRGFLFEHEIPGDLESNGESEAPVLSSKGDMLGNFRVSLADKSGPLEKIQHSKRIQTSQEREKLLAELDFAESQLLGWFLIHPSIGANLGSHDDELKNQIKKLLYIEVQWEKWLLQNTPEEPSEISNQLLSLFMKSGINRQHRGEIVREGLAYWKAFKTTSSDVYERPDQTISLWIETMGKIRRRLLEGNIRLVHKWSSKYRRLMSFRNSFRMGLIGFNRALNFFDSQKGFQLSTYAGWWIRQAVSRACSNHGNPIRTPVHLFGRISKFIFTYRELWQPGTSLTQTLRDTAIILEISPDESERLAHLAEPTFPSTRFSFDTSEIIEETLYDPSVYSPHSFLPGGDIFIAQQILHSMLDQLRDAPTMNSYHSRKNKRAFDIISRRLGIGLPHRQTLEHIGQNHDVTRERIRQIEVKTLEKFRQFHEKKIQPVLDQTTWK